MKSSVSAVIKGIAPGFWQYLKYAQYLRSGQCEPEIVAIEKLVSKNLKAIDVGVHMGFYTRRLKSLAKQVIAFEPNPDSADFARRIFRSGATIEQVALSDSNGRAVLKIPVMKNSSAASALGTISTMNPLGSLQTKEVDVEARTLDSFGFSDVGFIKIDVEGHEEAVIRGSLDTIKACRPTLMVEIEERHNPGGLSRICAIFRELGYDIRFLDQNKMRDVAEFNASVHQSGAKPYINNFFFFPRERPSAAHMI